MSRRYAEPVRVRTMPAGAPAQFLWRGRGYLVREVLCHWVEGTAWWRSSRRGDLEVWRVEAGPSRSSPAQGVYDLVHDPGSDQWHLERALD